MRVHNSLKNMFFGFAGQLVSALLGFLVRTVFIYTLDVEYLGVEGLFSSIFMMLSLANLGFDTAIIYSLYRPLAEKDEYKIKALMNLYKKAYRLVGLTIFILGLSIFPFLDTFINGGVNIDNLNLIYLLFLVNSAFSYFLIYKQSIIIADQRSYILSQKHTIFIFASNITQIILLLLTKNYILVLIFQILFRMLENIYISLLADKLYPFLKFNKKAKLSPEDKKIFLKDLYALLLYRISGVVINGTDNIVLSKYVGITSVGIYSNYLLIITTLNSFLSHIFYSLNASIGNLIVTETSEKKYFLFRVINFANFWIFEVCTVCLWGLLNPFISLWVGNGFLLDRFIVFCILLNFYTTGMQNASTAFRETTGLFKKGKYSPIAAAIINIIVSIILAMKIGMGGVLLGTVISRLCTFFWYDPFIIFKHVFGKQISIYFKKYALYALLVTVSALITDILSNYFYGHLLNELAFQMCLCFFVPNIIFWLFFRKSEEYLYLLSIGKLSSKKIFGRFTISKKKDEINF